MSRRRIPSSAADESLRNCVVVRPPCVRVIGLPTVRELMASLGVGQLTIQKAVGRLTQEGILPPEWVAEFLSVRVLLRRAHNAMCSCCHVNNERIAAT